MVFRNDVRTHGYGTIPISRIDLGLATSDDGIHWNASDKPFIPQSTIETDYEVDECLATADVNDLIKFCLDKK